MPKTKSKPQVDDITTATAKKKRKSTNRMLSAEKVNTAPTREQYGALHPVTDDALTNPVDWATKRLESNIPTAALEIEYQLKFGDARTRRELSLEVLGMKGVSSKGPQTGTVVPAIQLIMNGPIPWAQGPQPTLTEGNNAVTVEGELVLTKVPAKETT